MKTDMSLMREQLAELKVALVAYSEIPVSSVAAKETAADKLAGLVWAFAPELIALAEMTETACSVAKSRMESENAIYNKYDAMHTRALNAETENERLREEIEKLKGTT